MFLPTRSAPNYILYYTNVFYSGFTSRNNTRQTTARRRGYCIHGVYLSLLYNRSLHLRDSCYYCLYIYQRCEGDNLSVVVELQRLLRGGSVTPAPVSCSRYTCAVCSTRFPCPLIVEDRLNRQKKITRFIIVTFYYWHILIYTICGLCFEPAFPSFVSLIESLA